MHKVQCLNTAKDYLGNCLKSSLTFLQDANYWRNSFKDELAINYKDWLYKKLSEDVIKDSYASGFLDEVISEEV